jgi:hypothetical protein
MYSRPSGVENPPQYSPRLPVDHFVVNGEPVAMVVPVGGGAAVPAPEAGAVGWTYEEILTDTDFLHDCTDQKHVDMGVDAPQLDPDGWDIVCGALRE